MLTETIDRQDTAQQLFEQVMIENGFDFVNRDKNRIWEYFRLNVIVPYRKEAFIDKPANCGHDDMTTIVLHYLQYHVTDYQAHCIWEDLKQHRDIVFNV